MNNLVKPFTKWNLWSCWSCWNLCKTQRKGMFGGSHKSACLVIIALWTFALCFLFSSFSMAFLLPSKKSKFLRTGTRACKAISSPLGPLFELEVSEAQKWLKSQKSWRGRVEKVVFNASCSFYHRWHLLTLLFDRGPHNREIQKSKVMDSMIRALNNKEWLLRYVAIQYLPKWDALKAKEWSAKLLSDASLLVRSQAVKGFSPYLADRNYRNLLWAELKHPRNWYKGKSLWVRQQILQILLENPFSTDRQKWEELLAQEKDPLIRQRLRFLNPPPGKNRK